MLRVLSIYLCPHIFVDRFQVARLNKVQSIFCQCYMNTHIYGHIHIYIHTYTIHKNIYEYIHHTYIHIYTHTKREISSFQSVSLSQIKQFTYVNIMLVMFKIYIYVTVYIQISQAAIQHTA
jgi:hypothetical protein